MLIQCRKNLFHLFVNIIFLGFISCSKNSQPGSSYPPNQTNDSISFIVLGDWGKAGGEWQKKVASQMDVAARVHNTSFIITTGDNFYQRGVTSIYHPHWKWSYENIYNKPGHEVPWYPVLGNHDYGSNPQAEVDYTKISNRWTMPARYYSIKKHFSNAEEAVFLFTDTSPFINGYYGAGMSDLDKQDSAAQLSWLSGALRGNEKWKIVIGHHPVYSAGAHGNTSELLAKYRPLFNNTKTDFYICGHDHSLQYLVEASSKVHYLISGGGSENTYVEDHPNAVFKASSPGFLVMTLYPEKVHFYFYNQLGKQLYTGTVVK